MSPRLRQYRMLWRAALTHARPSASAVLGWSIVVVTALGALLAALTDDPRKALALAWCAPFGLTLMAWSWQFLAGAAKLNTPANAQLAPGMRPRLAELAFGTWFLCLAGIAACPFVDQATLAVATLWLGMLSLGSGLSAAGSTTGAVLIFASVALPPSRTMLPDRLQALAERPAFLVAELALLAAAGALAVAAMFPRAGERHWRLQARRKRLVSLRPMDRPGAGRVWRTATSWYGALLRRDCARRHPRSLLAHAFGTGPSRVEGAIGVLGMFVVGLAVIGLVKLHGSPAALEASAGIGWILASSTLFLPMMHADVALKTMPALAGEQALVRLAPLLPGAAPAFNRLLGRALLAQALNGWALAELAAFVLTWLSGASGATLVMQLCAGCLALPMLTLPLRDLSRSKSLRTMLSVLYLPGAVVACVGVGVVLRSRFGLPLMPGAAATALALAAACALRGWRKLVQAPFAFPAGRMD
jgi:hypothetical protein